VDQVSQRDLGLVPSLIAYWDTLGWVLYAQGNLHKADEYISAAWTLGQHGEVGDHLGQVYEKLGEKDKARQTYALALNGLRPVPETRERLAALVGGETRVPAELEKTRSERQQMRTISVPRAGNLSGNAEFLIMLTGGTSGIAVDGVKFVSGDDKLRTMVEPLRHAKIPMAFPDSTPTKIFRRGVMDCSGTARDCTFVMLVPDDVRSVD